MSDFRREHPCTASAGAAAAVWGPTDAAGVDSGSRSAELDSGDAEPIADVSRASDDIGCVHPESAQLNAVNVANVANAIGTLFRISQPFV